MSLKIYNRFGVLSIGLWGLLIFSMMSCQSQQMTSQELLHWFQQPDNGYVNIKKVGGIKFTVQYQPTQYMQLIHQEHKKIDSQTNIVVTIEPTDEKKFVGMKAKYPKMQLYDKLVFRLTSQGEKHTNTIQHQERGIDDNKRVINLTFDSIDYHHPFTLTLNALKSGGQLVHFTFENINHTIPELSIK